MMHVPYLCLLCEYYHGTQYQDEETCDAFPNGIPADIINGAPHFDPIDGDGGRVFRPFDDAGEPVREYLVFWFKPAGSEE